METDTTWSPPNHALTPHRFLVMAWLIFSLGTVNAATYDVGPAQPLGTPSDVPWESLIAGDVVNIHWRDTPYKNKWVINRQGTESEPIIVRGVPGPNGELPVIDGDGATTRQALDYWSETRGVIKFGGASIPSGDGAAHVIIENLEIRSGRPPYSFTDDSGAVQNYPNNAAAIFVEKGDHITIRNCALHDSGNGLFVSHQSSNVLVDGNYIYDNGNVGSIYEHNSYTAAAGITFQFNHYGPLREGCGGNNLKDRSAGLVVRYNWIEGGNRQLDLVDAEDSVALQQDPRYGTTYVYGNVLIEPDGSGNRQIVHYGGDSGNTSAYRKGTLHFYHNTIISTRPGRTTLFRLSTDDETADCRNNIIYATNSGNQLELLAGSGLLTLTHNWLKPGRVVSFDGAATGVVTDDGSNLTGTDPGVLSFTKQNFKLLETSPGLNAGTNLHGAVPPEYAVTNSYLKHQKSELRKLIGTPDLGAYEYSPFDEWRGAHFPNDFDNPSVSGEAADPDNDKLSNLVEYAFGLDPNQSTNSGLPQPVVLSVNGQDHLAMEFQRRFPPADLIYTTRVTSDFDGWFPGCQYSDTQSTIDTTHTADASDEQWTRVQLKSSIQAGGQEFIAIDVRREP
jgi:hypothetical protein